MFARQSTAGVWGGLRLRQIAWKFLLRVIKPRKILASKNSVEILVARYQQNIMEISWCSLFHVTPQIFFSALDNTQLKFPRYLW